MATLKKTKPETLARIQRMERKLREAATFTIHLSEEDCSPEHMERTQGLAPEFAEIVRENMRKSPDWGWCQVEVRCVVRVGNNSYQGTDHLSGCSYTSEAEFTQPGGYFEDMKKEAFEDLLSMLRCEVIRGREAARALGINE